MGFFDDIKSRALKIKTEAFAVYLAARHPGTPWYAKVFIAAVGAYAFSPIDLIPDFIPILGYIDDIILIPLGIALAVKMIPASVLAECRKKAQEKAEDNKLKSIGGAVAVILIWVLSIAACGFGAYWLINRL